MVCLPIPPRRHCYQCKIHSAKCRIARFGFSNLHFALCTHHFVVSGAFSFFSAGAAGWPAPAPAGPFAGAVGGICAGAVLSGAGFESITPFLLSVRAPEKYVSPMLVRKNTAARIAVARDRKLADP